MSRSRSLCERGLSKRRACGLLELSRSSLSYRLRLPAKDAPVLDGDAGPVVAVPALRLPAHPHLPAAPRPSAGLAPHPPAVAPSGTAAAAPATAATDCCQSAATVASHGRQLRLGLRLRLRRLRQRPADQVPDHRRRVHPRVPGHRRGRLDPLPARDRRPGAADQRARRAAFLRSDNGPEFVSRAILEWLPRAAASPPP